MKTQKITSIALAALLQIVPITRGFIAAAPASSSSFAIVATWIAGAAALLGGIDAVSGASSIVVSPVSGTVGVAFNGVIQYSGGHAADVRSWELRNNWSGAVSGCNSIYQIAPGLWLTNSATYLAKLGGTPTTSGTFSFTIRVYSGTGCGGGDNDSRSASITINPGTGSAPTISSQPTNQLVAAGANASFTVAASGTAPLSYQWRLSSTNLTGATNATLALSAVTSDESGGSYSCIVSNPAGTATSSAATLTVIPLPLRLYAPQLNGTTFTVRAGTSDGALLTANRAAKIQFYTSSNATLPFSSWQPLGTSPMLSNGVLYLNGAPTANAPGLFFRAVETP